MAFVTSPGERQCSCPRSLALTLEPYVLATCLRLCPDESQCVRFLCALGGICMRLAGSGAGAVSFVGEEHAGAHTVCFTS